MARIRSIKPDFFRHEGLYEAEREEGMPLRVAFAGLWTAADREGRFRWSPRILKLDCLPHDDVDFSRVLHALWTRGFIEKYVCDGKEYGLIPGFAVHQVINNREAASALPEPNETNILTREARVDDASGTRLVHAQGEGKGREGKGTIGANAPNGSYAFQGSVVRLRQDAFAKWVKAFPNLDLLAELTARDAWLSSDRATESDRKNWFASTSQHLANRNRDAKVKLATARVVSDGPYKSSLIEGVT